MRYLFLAHVGATLAMVGVIWVVQVVHYPLFAKVGVEQFVAYEQDHTRLISFIVLPLMLVELIGAVALIWHRPEGVPMSLVWVGVALVGVVWVSTMALQMPQHGKLAGGFDGKVHAALVTTNWIRTIAWSARGVIVLVMVEAMVRAASR